MSRSAIVVAMLPALAVVVGGCATKTQQASVAPVTSDLALRQEPICTTQVAHFLDGTIQERQEYEVASREEFIAGLPPLHGEDVAVYFSWLDGEGVRRYYREAYEFTPVEVLNRDGLWADYEVAPRAPKALRDKFFGEEDPLPELAPGARASLEIPGREKPIEAPVGWRSSVGEGRVEVAFALPLSAVEDLKAQHDRVTITLGNERVDALVSYVMDKGEKGEKGEPMRTLGLAVNLPAELGEEVATE